MDQNIENVIYLAACAANRQSPADVDRMDLDEVFKVAGRHLLSAAVSFALSSAGVEDERVRKSILRAQKKTIIFDAEKSALFDRFEEAGIWYMPLKGAVLKDYYPEFGMREMADYDILFDASRSDDVKAIMESRGFTTKRFNTTSNHDVYYKEPVTNFEMHRSLFGVFHEDKLSSYYADVKDRLVKDEGNGFGYHFTDEDFYIYMTAHEYKHFSRRGTGIRSLLDTYVYLNRFKSLDWNYISRETKKLGIDEFEISNRKLAEALFTGDKIDDKAMLEYMLDSGVFGNIGNGISNSMSKQRGGKLGYMIRRTFLPMELVKKAYPRFYRYKVLLPVLPLYRLYLKKKEGRLGVGAELKALWKRR